MSTVPNQQIQQPLSNENIDKIVESSPLAQCIEPAVTEIATVMQSVYDSQELLAKQLDTIEATILTFRELPALAPVSDYLEKLIATKQLLLHLKGRISTLQQRTETIKTSLRNNQAAFAAKQAAGQPGIGLSADDEHLLQ